MANIVTTTDVMDALGLSVSATDITRAQAVLETITGRQFDLTNTYVSHDLYLLKQAVIWETAYLQNNPTVLSAQSGVASASTNGVSISYTADGVEASLVAPMAKRALRKLSWNRRSRTVFLNPAQYGVTEEPGLIDNDDLIWTKI